MRIVPRYSVLIPAFNHADFIEEAITSALDDGGDDVEVIVVDDGSTDDTPSVLRDLLGDERLTVHSQENQGAHVALNRLLGIGRGEFFFILNSDDAFEPGRLRQLADRLTQSPGAVIACSNLRIVDASGHEIGVKHGWRDLPPWPVPQAAPHLTDLNDPILALLQTNWASTTSNLAFRRDLIVEHNLAFANLRYTHDWNFLLTASAFGDITVTEEALVRYRVHESNTIRECDGRSQAQMRFEILWTVARHAAPTMARAALRGFDPDRLKERLMRSMPTFGRADLLYQLLAIRGTDDAPPANFDAMLNPEHPYRRAALVALEKQS